MVPSLPGSKAGPLPQPLCKHEDCVDDGHYVPTWMASLRASAVGTALSNVSIASELTPPEDDGHTERDVHVAVGNQWEVEDFVADAKCVCSESRDLRITAVRTQLSHIDSEILRGVPLSTVLARCGSWIRSGPICGSASPSAAAGDKMYALSAQLSNLAEFLSHSWHANPWEKTLALLVFYNGGPATIAGLAGGLLCAGLTILEILPVWIHGVDAMFLSALGPGAPSHLSFSGWSWVAFVVCYVVILIYWQPIRGIFDRKCRTHVFFDKLCIHQVSPDLKKKGVASISGFLLNSNAMVILWDQTYLTRVWCVFEVAVFVGLKPRGIIKFVPVTALTMVPTSVMATAAVVLLFSVSIVFNIAQYLVSLLVNWGLPVWLTLPVLMWGPVAFVLVPCAFHQRKYFRTKEDLFRQLRDFSISGANCFDDRDREFLKSIVIKLYGSEAQFVRDARAAFLRIIDAQFGENFSPLTVHLTKVQTSVLPAIVFLALDLCVALHQNTASYRLHLAFGMLISFGPNWCLYAHIQFKIFGLRLKTTSRKEEFSICAGVASLSAFVMCISLVLPLRLLMCQEFTGKIIILALSTTTIVAVRHWRMLSHLMPSRSFTKHVD